MQRITSIQSDTARYIIAGIIAGAAFAVAFFPPCGAVVWRLILWMGGM